MVKLRRVYEALPSSPLTRKCKEEVTRTLGVMPFPDGEDTILFKATYFCFKPDSMNIVTGEDARIKVKDDSITLFMNRSCNPDGEMAMITKESINDDNPFAKAFLTILDSVQEEAQKNGREWCRIGNYKTLEIKSPYLDRLKAFCIQNPDVKIPLVASKQITEYADTPEVNKTLALLNGESLPEAKVKKINDAIPDGVKPRVRKIAPEKPMSDRQKKNQLNKLLSVGIGGGKDKAKPSNPRVRKV